MVDRATGELQGIQFQYVNLRPTEMTGAPGGALAWRRLPEGSWIIEYWAISLPVFETRSAQLDPRYGAGAPVRGPPRPVPQIGGLARVTTGGGVVRVAFGDSIVWLADQPLEPRVPVPLPPP